MLTVKYFKIHNYLTKKNNNYLTEKNKNENYNY